MKKSTSIIRYILGSLFVLAGIGLLAEETAAGICLIMSGIMMTPKFWAILANRGCRPRRSMKAAMPILLFFLAAFAMPPSQSSETAANLVETAAAYQTQTAEGETVIETVIETAIVQTVSEESEQQVLPAEMEVHFIDVGQGDATLIKSGDAAMLIDAGDDTKGTFLQNYLNKQGVKRLDYLILTHPDADHIGGAPVIITKFEVDKVFMSNFEKDNQTYRKLIQALDDKRLLWETPETGSRFQLGDASFTILAPAKQYSDPNNASVALLLQNGENSFLFTGDAEEEAEKVMLTGETSVRADVYQAGHHGSRSSSSIEFMQAVNPTYAVISCAEGNTYGHPHAQTLNRFRERGMQIFRTDEQGSIVAVSDGAEITWNCAPSQTWQAGEPTGSGTAAGSIQSGGSETAADSQAIQESRETPAVETMQEPKQEVVEETPQDSHTLTYVLNVSTKKFHRPSCGSLPTTNRRDSSASREEVIAQGYVPCKRCNP